MILSKVYENAERRLERNEITIGEFERLVDIEVIEPKRGEWIDRSDGGRILNSWWENYECNRCGYYGSGTWNFCPNCGSKMRGEYDD